MSDMAIQSESYIGRLRSFYDDIVMDVVHTFFELKVLGTKSFHCFLDDNLHILFHKRNPRKRCCKCSEVLLANQNRLPELEKEQFELLYVYDHQSAAIQDNEHSDKRNECLHRYSPKTTTVSEGVITLDICLICILVKNCCITGTFPGNPAVLDKIKKCRNSIYHLGTQNAQVHQMFDAKWALLESSVLDLGSTLGKAYIHGLKKRIEMINSKHQLLAEISRSVSDKVTERIVLELCNQKVQIDNLEIRTTFQPQQRESDSGEAVGDLNKCYVVWKFANPGNWDVERMADKLKCVSKLLDFSIEFVYAGCIILTTSASFAIFSSEKGFTAVMRDFLKLFIKTIEVDTSKQAKVDTFIEIYWSAPVEYMPNKEQRAELATKLETETEYASAQVPLDLAVTDDFPIEDYYYRHRVRPQRNMTADPRYGEKERLLYSCQQRMGNVHSGKHPLNIAVIGRPGGGKSSFLNSVFASFNMDTWRQIAQHGYFGDGHLQVTSRFISYPKAAYYRSHDNSLMPTFLDMTGFEDESSEINRAVLQFVFCGRIRDYETILEARQYAYVHGASGLLRNYNKNVNKYPVDRIIVVCSPRVPLPTSFLDDVIVVAKEMRDIPVYGILTHRDKFAPNEIPDFIRSFRGKLGLPLNRFAFIKNYCEAVDPEMIHLDTCIPSLDVPILRFMTQVLSPVQKDRLIVTDWFIIVWFVVLMLAFLLQIYPLL